VVGGTVSVGSAKYTIKAETIEYDGLSNATPQIKTAYHAESKFVLSSSGFKIKIAERANWHLEISTIAGRIVYRKHGMGETICTVSSKKLMPGIYMARIFSSNQDRSFHFALTQ
jgi:hypothetical protein